jgi:hypothetical protein
LPSNRKQQIEEYLKGVHESEEYKYSSFKNAVDKNEERLLELAGREDEGDDSVLEEMTEILQNIDRVLTDVNRLVVALLGMPPLHTRSMPIKEEKRNIVNNPFKSIPQSEVDDALHIIEDKYNNNPGEFLSMLDLHNDNFPLGKKKLIIPIKGLKKPSELNNESVPPSWDKIEEILKPHPQKILDLHQMIENQNPEEKKWHVLTHEQHERLLITLEQRFKTNMNRHEGISWEGVSTRLNEADPQKLWSLNEMKRTGGEPDVVGFDYITREIIFMDCSAESPSGRRDCVYNRDAEKDVLIAGELCHGNAVDRAAEMGIELLTSKQYIDLQKMIGKLDTSTSGWVKTPPDVVKQNNAYVGQRIVGEPLLIEEVITSHNGRRGFRGVLRI